MRPTVERVLQFTDRVRVLVCVDDDAVLDTVLTSVEAFVDATQWDEILVLHVLPSPPLHVVEGPGDPTHDVRAFVASVAERIAHLPATVETLVATGNPAETIVRTADANDVDLIVVGARGEDRDFYVGSVSQKVVSVADSDVLVIRACDPPVSELRALITVDGSRGSEAGITSFSTKLRASHAEIHLVHVIDSLPTLWEVSSRAHAVSGPLVRHAEELLARAAALLAARGLDAECEWHHGSPAREIVDIARRRRCSLIVVGARGHSRLSRLLLGPLTQRILRHAPCTVLCARAWSRDWAALSSEWSSEADEPQVGMA